jgi:hypothetical protein
MRNFIMYVLHLILLCVNGKEYAMYGVCSTHGRMRNATKFCSENLQGRDHLEGLDVGEA